MIDWLAIRHFAIAEHLELDFESGFTTITGETGSGKSLIIDALSLLLGGRSDHSLIRHDCDKAEIQGGFALPSHHAALNWLIDQELDNDGECILRREIRQNKPSKAYINGKAVPASQLKQLGNILVDIHGQHEHHSLLNAETQRQFLDGYSGCIKEVKHLNEIFTELDTVRQELDELNSNDIALQEKVDLLSFQLQELELLNPVEEEWSVLDEQQKKLSHLQELISSTRRIADILHSVDDNAITGKLGRSMIELERLEKYDDKLKVIVSMLSEANVNIEEAHVLLQSISDQNDLDEEEINALEQRCSLYHTLARKHRIPPDELLNKLESIRSEISSISDPETERKRLEETLAALVIEYNQIATQVSEKRQHGAEVISNSVTQLMQELGMQGGEFQIHLAEINQGSPSRYGNESIQFLVTANRGQPLKTLSKVASGGELSRISLAIQVLSANAAQVPTLIFDEVDVGISGAVADVVGKKLKELGHDTQVLCITHLSQVASRGNHHLSVSKSSGADINIIVTDLNHSQRVTELAKMTGGQTITPESLAHAEKMLQTA